MNFAKKEYEKANFIIVCYNDKDVIMASNGFFGEEQPFDAVDDSRFTRTTWE